MIHWMDLLISMQMSALEQFFPCIAEFLRPGTAHWRIVFGEDRSKGSRMEDYIEAVHPEDRDWVTRRRKDLMDGTGSGDIEYRVVWPDRSVHWIFGRATVEELRQDLRAVSQKCRPDWDITTPELKAAWEQGRKDLFFPYGKSYAQMD